MKIGLFGGTFDPIHIGHLIIAETVKDTLKLDKIIFIPAANPPHKLGKRITDSRHRLSMIQMAIVDHKDFQLSEIEIAHKSSSYSTETVQLFLDLYPSDELLFLIGGDSLKELHTWHEPDRLLKMIKIVVVQRPGINLKKVSSCFLDQVIFVDAPLIGISSSNIRQNILEQRSIRYLVPDSVADYIHENKLYNKC